MQKNILNSSVKFLIKYYDRNHTVCYFDKDTKEEYFSDVLVLAMNDKLISQFHPEQAFFIGNLAGLKIYFNKNNVVFLRKELTLDQTALI